MLSTDRINTTETDDVVETVRGTVGEKAVEFTADYFEDEYRAKQRDTTVKAFGAGIAVGIIASAAAVLRRRD